MLAVKRKETSIETKSQNQSGGITAHTVNMAAQPAAPRSGWDRWQTRVPVFVGIATILTFLGMKLPDWFRSEPKPTPTMNNETPKSSVTSEKQSGGVTAHTVNMNVNAMQPQVEGVRIYTRQISSPREDAPYAIEITVQVSGSVQPFGLAVLCDKEVVQGRFSMVGNSMYQNVQEGHINADPKKSYFFTFGSPAITPGTPLMVTIMCKEPFNILRVQRVNP